MPEKDLDPRATSLKKSRNQVIKSEILGILTFGVFFFGGVFFLSHDVQASILSSLFSQSAKAADESSSSLNSQNMPLLVAPIASTLNGKIEGKVEPSDVTIVGGTSLLPETGPSGSIADVEQSDGHSDQISIYVVHQGDTLAEIAKMFDVSVNTILWANDITGGKISVGQTLVILPVSGIKYTVKSGDTISSIAKKFKGDEREILQFNGLSDGATLASGDIVIIPDGEMDAPAPVAAKPSQKLVYGDERLVKGYDGPNYDSYYIRPIVGGRKTQGLHGYNAVDLGTPLRTPVHAAAAGTVIISKSSGWNGGYGNYVAIQHPNKTETLYAHLTEPEVTVGEHVEQGDLIGLSGSTGKSTGPHLHFEIRGAQNPF